MLYVNGIFKKYIYRLYYAINTGLCKYTAYVNIIYYYILLILL